MFTDSTHQLLFIDTITLPSGIIFEVQLRYRIWAYSIIIVQFGAHSYLAHLILRECNIGEAME